MRSISSSGAMRNSRSWRLCRRLLKSGNRSAGCPDLQDVPNLSYHDNGAVVENELTYTAAPEDLDKLNFTDLTFLEHHKEYYVHEYIVTDVEAALKALETRPILGPLVVHRTWLPVAVLLLRRKQGCP